MANCLDATPENNPYCYSNITWAMETGITTNPMWYADYPILSEYQSRAAFQYVLHEKRGPGVADITGKPDGPGYNCTKPCGISPLVCKDITEQSPGICYTNVLWAMQTGINDFPQYYDNYPRLKNTSSFTDFQFVLHEKVNDNRSGELPNGPGWQCPMPCTSVLFIPTTTSTIAITSTGNMTRDITPTTTLTSTTTSTTTTTTTEASSSFPWWSWLLLICGLLLCLGAIAAFFLSKKGGAAKKAKRSVSPKKSAPAPAPAVAPTPVATAPSVYTQVQPVQTVQPMYARAVPVQTAAIPVAAPVQAMAVPAYQYAAAPGMQQASSLFDQMDVNHDGVITRAEFARMMGR